MMNLCERILTIYPELNGYDFALGSIRLQDDGDGNTYIAVWDHPTLERPSQEQLDALTGDYHDQAGINADARAYLASTDWYVIRYQETGAPIPAEVLSERRAARERISREV